MSSATRAATVGILLILVFAPHARAQAPGVGQVAFPNSGTAAAQQDFLTGLAQLHNFEYGPAAELFRKAQQRDPGFAMAYWGEALTHTHPVWFEQDLAAARAVLQKLGATPDARLAKARTERERDYLRAVEVLYGEGEKKARDIAYAGAMESIRRKYPDDVEATAFTAVALLGTSHARRDFAIYMRAAALLEPVFVTHPKHPGIAHYLIHSYDDPIHAPLGLRAAREYSKIAPDAAHAQHMCSHIFVAMGMWDDVVAANEAAVRVAGKMPAANRPPVDCGHYPFWLMYGYLQQGRLETANAMVKKCRATIVAAKSPVWGSFITLRARYLIDTEEWSGDIASLAASPTAPPAVFTEQFVNAFGAIRRGNLDAARSAFAKMQAARHEIEHAAGTGSAMPMPGMTMPPPDASSVGRVKVLHDEIAALLRHKEGATREAVELLRAAAALEDTMPFEFGPPYIDKPAYELLGEVLLEAGQAPDARAAFEKALSRTPERTAALVGLMKAAAQMGDRTTEAEIKARLQTIWRRADRKQSTLQ